MKDIATLAIPANTLCRLLQYADAHQAGLSAGELAALAMRNDLLALRAPRYPASACAVINGKPYSCLKVPSYVLGQK